MQKGKVIKIYKYTTERDLDGVEECLTPTPGDCWNSVRLMDYNCDKCKYWDGCTYVNKGKWKVEEKKQKNGNGGKSKKMKRKK